MRKQVLIHHTTSELIALRSLVNIDEVNRLSLQLFNPFTRFNCVYGLLTGDCESIRAKFLMESSAKGEVIIPQIMQPIQSLKSLERPEAMCNIRRYTGSTWTKQRSSEKTIIRSYFYMSPLETYIRIKGAKIENIISFLQERTDILIIDKTY